MARKHPSLSLNPFQDALSFNLDMTRRGRPRKRRGAGTKQAFSASNLDKKAPDSQS